MSFAAGWVHEGWSIRAAFLHHRLSGPRRSDLPSGWSFFAGLLGSPIVKLLRGSRSSNLEGNISEDYGMKSFNGIVFAVLGLMVLILNGAIVFIKAGRPKHASEPRTTQSSSSRQPQ